MRWSTEQIREARQAPILPLLFSLGYQVRGLPDQNYAVRGFDDLRVKQHYWRWPSRNVEGNAIDFLVKVQGQTFHQAMQTITTSQPPPS